MGFSRVCWHHSILYHSHTWENFLYFHKIIGHPQLWDKHASLIWEFDSDWVLYITGFPPQVPHCGNSTQISMLNPSQLLICCGWTSSLLRKLHNALYTSSKAMKSYNMLINTFKTKLRWVLTWVSKYKWGRIWNKNWIWFHFNRRNSN